MGNNIKEVKSLMPEVQYLFLQCCHKLKAGKVPILDLAFTKMLSKDSSEYTVNTVETGSLSQLVDEGETMRAGEVMQYVITDNNRKNAKKRSVPVELINEKTSYDARRYIELLAETCNSVTKPLWLSSRWSRA